MLTDSDTSRGCPSTVEAKTASDRLLPVLVEFSFVRTLEQLTSIVRRTVRQLTGADGVTFVLKDGDECAYVDEDAISPLWKGRRFPSGQCISGWAMINRQTAVVPDIYSDDRLCHDAYRPTFVKSLLMVPVRQEDPVAAIGVYWGHHHQATPGEQDLVQVVANGASLAMANLGLLRDLEHAAERERSARIVAERANELTEQFLQTVSHELRTPLGVIRGWLWQLRQPGVSADMVRHGLAVIERNATIQARLVEDLLDSSSAMSGAVRLRRALLDLNGVCGVVVEAARQEASQKGIALDVACEAAPLLVYGDLDRLQQVVANLVENAVKFTPPGGSVRVVASRTGGRASVVVRDSGVGLPADVLPHVFERFWMRDAGSTRTTSGLGLGLTIVQELVKLHGGRVRAESAGEGLGTTMTVVLPIPALKQEPGDWLRRRSGDAGYEHPLGGIRVLVVSEDRDNGDAIRQLLESRGARAEFSERMEQWLKQIGEDAPDLLIVDGPLAPSAGDELVRALRRWREMGRRIPVVQLSADAESSDPGVVSPPDLVLDKPIAPEELSARLAALAPTLRSMNHHGTHAADR